MMPLTVSVAASTVSKTPSNVRPASGSRLRPTVTFVTMPKVPSWPTITPGRSYPGQSSTTPPVSKTEPSGKTNSTPRTKLTVTPYFSVCGPPEFVATLPPMVQAVWLDGSGA